MSCDTRKPVFGAGFPTRPGTNQAVQPQKMARGFNFFLDLKSRENVAKTKALISCTVTAQISVITGETELLLSAYATLVLLPFSSVESCSKWGGTGVYMPFLLLFYHEN